MGQIFSKFSQRREIVYRLLRDKQVKAGVIINNKLSGDPEPSVDETDRLCKSRISFKFSFDHDESAIIQGACSYLAKLPVKYII
jgi:hypothetical protein